MAPASVALLLGLLVAAPASAAGGYGQIPRWIPRPKLSVGRVVVASRAHPQLAIQGDTVSVRLGRGRVLATVVGPSVPEEGEFPVPPTSPCTFVLTLSNVSGLVPLVRSAFTILDEEGREHVPQVTAINGAALPPRARPGRTVRLRLHAVLPTGNGQLRWAPGGGVPIVSWDFDVEID